jgi:hypothetical protein
VTFLRQAVVFAGWFRARSEKPGWIDVFSGTVCGSLKGMNIKEASVTLSFANERSFIGTALKIVNELKKTGGLAWTKLTVIS